MATAVDAAIAEVDERLAVFAPQHEGLRDFGRLNLEALTQAAVTRAIADYDRRVALLTAARAALVAVRDDGHPDLPRREIDPVALADLQANLDTVAAARGIFASNVATAVALEGAGVELK